MASIDGIWAADSWLQQYQYLLTTGQCHVWFEWNISESHDLLVRITVSSVDFQVYSETQEIISISSIADGACFGMLCACMLGAHPGSSALPQLPAICRQPPKLQLDCVDASASGSKPLSFFLGASASGFDSNPCRSQDCPGPVINLVHAGGWARASRLLHPAHDLEVMRWVQESSPAPPCGLHNVHRVTVCRTISTHKTVHRLKACRCHNSLPQHSSGDRQASWAFFLREAALSCKGGAVPWPLWPALPPPLASIASPLACPKRPPPTPVCPLPAPQVAAHLANAGRGRGCRWAPPRRPPPT